MSEHVAERALPPARNEQKDVGLKFILKLLSLIAVVLVLLMGLAYWIFPGEIADHRFQQPFPAFPGPQLQPSPRLDMRTFYEQEMQELNGTGWQDKAAGTVHIPIEQAMRAVAAEGIPGWPTGQRGMSQGDRR